jgi:hypothetical protein
VSAAWLAQRFGSYSALLATAAAVYLVGAMLWLLIDPSKRIEAPDSV